MFPLLDIHLRARNAPINKPTLMTKFQKHTLIFLLMVLPPVGMYFAAQNDAADIVLWLLLAPVVFASVWALWVK